MAPHFMFDELDPMEEFQSDLSMISEEAETHEELPDDIYDYTDDSDRGNSLEHARLECIECGHIFKSANTEDPTCPRCGSEDLELE